MSISAEYMRAALEAAIERFIAVEEYLLKVDSSERSITHHLAIHLASNFPEHQTDCEFNRDGFNSKKLALAECTVSNEATEAVTVFPDIVVHQRGSKDKNLLAIEVKKATSTESSEYDYKKLRAFKSELNYEFAAHVVIGYDKNHQLVRATKWIDG